jgi:oligopeptide/dipeptide ABC transporter ATP-binding protein
MVAEASQYLASDPWMIVPGGLVIALTIVSFGLFGDAARDLRADATTNRRLAPAGRARSTASEAGPALKREVGAATGDDLANDMFASVERTVGAGPGGTGVSANREVLIGVRNLSVAISTGDRADIPVVDDVSFDVCAGEALGIVGESGCGKTVTALALLGLLPRGLRVTSGSLSLAGTKLENLERDELRQMRGSVISMISQEPIVSLDPCYSVGAQLAEVVRRHSDSSRSMARRRVLELLDMVKLPEPRTVASRYPHQLSGGMAQRVSIAAALAGNPRVLVADEPTTALDVTVQAEILDLLRLLRESGLALILVSHDWGVIADSCDAALVMYAGQVVERADIVTMFRQSRHPYTRGLMGANPHSGLKPRTRLPGIGGSVLAVGEWPVGCRFAARCDLHTPECDRGPIHEEALGSEHWVRCIYSADLAPSSRRIEEPVGE